MKNEASFNEATGQTIVFKSAEQLLEESSPEMKPYPAPRVPEAQGKTFTEIARESSVEFSPSVKETIPETVSLDQLRSDSIARLNGQYQEL